ncbi:MAG: hypothetical protein AB1403_22825 [Candidatus Riflebacteria bacterium]
MIYQQIPYDLDSKLSKELVSDEQIEWKGMPIPRLLKAETLAIFLFAIPWTAFSIFWICGAAGFKIPDFSKGFDPFMLFPLFGLPFLLIGLAMLASPIFSYLADRKTLYAVTDRRVIIITGGRSYEIKSFLPEKISELTRRERAAAGDLIFAQRISKDSDDRDQTVEIGFFNISDIQGAKEAMQKLMENHYEKKDNDEFAGWESRNQ